MTRERTHRAIEAVWRIESAKIVAAVARLVRDIGLAEELAQDALVAALEHWPSDGVPDNPAAWLMATARNRALDRLRRDRLLASKHEELGRDLEAQEALVVPDFVDALDDARADVIGDDLLRLIFTACHPLLSTEARVALTLKLLGGLTTAEIARAYLVAEPTVAQRIVRAKRTLSEAGVPYELPSGDALAARLASVLEVIYLIFNEGYTATSGDDWMRPALTDEALRLGRVLAGLAPQEPEVHGLVALMELQTSRAPARVDAQGQPVLLMDQDRSRWDHLLIRRGLAALERAAALGAGDPTEPRSVSRAAAAVDDGAPAEGDGAPAAAGDGAPGGAGDGALGGAGDGVSGRAGDSAPARTRPAAGPYVLQAAIAACHARARTADETDWPRIVALYDALSQVTPSPVVALNRAVAVGMAYGPAAALELVEAMQAEPVLQNYHWLPSVQGDLLARLGRPEEARAHFERAASLARNARERALLLARVHALDGTPARDA